MFTHMSKIVIGSGRNAIVFKAIEYKHWEWKRGALRIVDGDTIHVFHPAAISPISITTWEAVQRVDCLVGRTN